MFLNYKNFKTSLHTCLTTAFLMFLGHSAFSDIDFNVINLIIYLISSFIGAIVSYVYYHFFSRQISNNRYLYIFFPGFIFF